MKRSILYFFIFLSIHVSSFGQTKPEIDSLVNKGKNLLNSDLTKSLENSYKAFKLSQAESYYWGQVNAAQWIAEAYYYRSNLDSALHYDKIALNLSRQENDLPEIANNLVAMGQKQADQGKRNEALLAFKEAEEIMVGRKDTFDLADLYLRLGGVYIDIDEHDQATNYLSKSLAYSKQLNNPINQAYAIGSMGIVQKKIGNIDESIRLTEEALAIYKKRDDAYSIAASLINIGILRKDKGQYQEALSIYNEAEEWSRKVEYAPLEMGLKINKGILLNLLGKYSQAKKTLSEAKQIAASLNILETLSDITSQLAKSEYFLGNKTIAENLLQESIAFAKEGRSFEKQKEAHQIGVEIYEKEGNQKKLTYHLKELQIAKDSLYSSTKARQVNNFQIKYDTAKKDAEIQLLNKQAELEKYQRLGLISGIVLLFITAGAIVFSLVQKRKKDRQIFEQEKELERIKRQNAEQELEFKKKELTAKVLQLARKNEFLGSLENELDDLKNNVDQKVTKTSSRIVRLIKQDTSEDKEWEQFGQEFSSVHQGFFDKLIELHGSFTQSETRLLSLLKMNLSSKDIADTLRISDEGIKKARYRLRKKLNLTTDEDLQSYLAGIT